MYSLMINIRQFAMVPIFWHYGWPVICQIVVHVTLVAREFIGDFSNHAALVLTLWYVTIPGSCVLVFLSRT